MLEGYTTKMTHSHGWQFTLAVEHAARSVDHDLSRAIIKALACGSCFWQHGNWILRAQLVSQEAVLHKDEADFLSSFKEVPRSCTAVLLAHSVD